MPRRGDAPFSGSGQVLVNHSSVYKERPEPVTPSNWLWLLFHSGGGSVVISCQHCPNKTRLTEAGARSIGWRMYSGPSVTGKELSDVACPNCSGRGHIDPLPPSWDIRCSICHWIASDDGLDHEPIISAREARAVAKLHECEPEFEYLAPGSDTWIREYHSEFTSQLNET